MTIEQYVEQGLAQAGNTRNDSRHGTHYISGRFKGKTPAQAALLLQQEAAQRGLLNTDGTRFNESPAPNAAPVVPGSAAVPGIKKPTSPAMVTVPSYGGGTKQIPDGGLPGGLKKPPMGSIATPLSPALKAGVGIISPAAGLAIEGQRIAANNQWESAVPPPAGKGEKVPERPPSVGLIEGIPANQWFQKEANRTGQANSASRPGGTIKPQTPSAPPPAANPTLPPGFADVEKRAAAVSGAAKGIASTQALIDQTQKIITASQAPRPATAPAAPLKPLPQGMGAAVGVISPAAGAAIEGQRIIASNPVKPPPASPPRPNDPLIGSALPAGQSMQEQGYALPVPFAGPGPAFPRTNLGPPGFPVSALPPPTVSPSPPRPPTTGAVAGLQKPPMRF